MGRKKILIIDDDPRVARGIENVLFNLGYSVSVIMFTGEDTLPRVEKENPDLVLIDPILNHKMSGIHIASEIRKRLDIPLIFITRSTEKNVIHMARRTLPSGYLLKPVSEKTLEIAISMALYRKAKEKRLEKDIKKDLSEGENRYGDLIENISQGIFVLDKKDIITFANKKFLEMLGYNKDDVEGQPITRLLGEGWLRKGGDHKANAKKNRWKSVELAWKRKDGKRVFTMLSPKPIYNKKGKLLGSIAVLTDITDRREVEMELRRSHEELRNLSQHLQSVREKESKRIASEIHDELGQQLTALKMDLSWLSNRVPFYEKDNKKTIEKINTMSNLIDRTIQVVQKISAELRPGLLDDLGLVPAIEWLAQDFQTRTNIRCKVHFHSDEIELDPDCSTAIYRISQEALTNIARHAKASLVDIYLKQESGVVILEISDNGKGIKENEICAPSSLGLMGMRERVRTFGGELNIIGAPNKGTTLKASLPRERS
jgi:two-component system sensor histidine kinase UhpB